MLGLAAAPEITVTRALELFWSFADDRINGKCDDQVRRWRNPRLKAVKNFVDVVGDVPLRDLTQDHMLDFREWWWEKIKEDYLALASGNKDFIHLANIFRTVNTMKRLSLDLTLSGLSFKAGEKTVRLPFSTNWIKEKILAPGALDGLNVEARTVLLGMINTSYHAGLGDGVAIHSRRKITGHDMILETASIYVANGSMMLDRLRMMLRGDRFEAREMA
jgi:hypothetical protein